MKTLRLVIIITLGILATSMVAFVLNSYLNTHPPLTLQNTESHNDSSSANPGNYDTTSVSTIIIPKGSSDPSSGKNYEPRYLLVVLGVNNTVRWINEDDLPGAIVADTDNQPDPLFEKGPYSNGVIMSGKSFNFTFTKIGEYQYDTEPHPWLYGWVLVLPQSLENATQTVIVNDTKIPGPCEIFALPCPNSTSFTAQKFGSNVYVEKVTVNGYDKYAIVHPSRNCVYPPSYDGNKTCRNPDDLAILRLVGIDTSIPRENLNITINGLNSTYVMGDPINFGIKVKGYGHCDFPSVLVIHEGVIVWQSKTTQTSCPFTMSQIDDKYTIGDLGGPLYLNQSGTYTVHVGYASNMTEKRFGVIQYQKTTTFDTGIHPFSINVTNTNFTLNYNIFGNNKVLDANMDMQSKSLILSLETTSNGTLALTMPRAMIDAKLPTGNDDKFYVLVNGQESIFQEVKTTTTDRTILIPFTNETHVIEIIGAQII
ncbi:Putative blue (Type 1) copper containing protein [Nitrosotalea devaniterrae]|uniref:Blue (Type 1) copper containing protein n=1 Tax=Nitrosotalea devaniterrae TaxID=1078905 RepID=A0A128A1Y7_9ARCH|nr:Putative blue (Type 1) copper containing protein [Candidatus Nitrosotalea devanaterra]